MKAKKWLAYITGIFSMGSIIAAFIIGKSSNCIFYDISLAIFGSALLGTIMSLTEYFVERRKAMEVFWDEARKAVNELRNIKYINAEPPHELILACFKEEMSNEWNEALKKPKSEIAKNNLISWFEENKVMAFTPEDDIDAELERLYEREIKGFYGEYQRAIDSYSVAGDIDLGPLSNAYGGLDFFFNKKVRNRAYSEIYDKIRKFRNHLSTEAFHFNLLKEEKGNFAVCAEKAYQINQMAFSEEYKDLYGASEKIVYHKLCDELDDSMEWFRCEIYRSEKYKPIEKVPILGAIKAISFEEK